MAEQKRHDSLAPRGAFAGRNAAETDLASAQVATLVARSSGDDEPEITIGTFDEPFPIDESLCADDLLAAKSSAETDRVSVEDAMRALIDLRLERSRPSDDFGTFDVANQPRALAPVTTMTNETRQMNSLAPIELAPAAPSRLAAQPTRKRSPFPILAAAALALLAVGIYRRADRQQPTEQTPTTQAAAQPTSTASVPALVAQPEPVAIEDAVAVDDVATEMQVLDVSESDDAILTLGTPTIINLPATSDDAKPSARPSVRAGKEVRAKQETVAATPTKPNAPASPASEATSLPQSPSRDAIVAGFNSVRDEVVACANGGGGVAPIEATIIRDGRITHATVGGYYQGTPAGSCIARALRKARFAPFGGESIKVTFPYTL